MDENKTTVFTATGNKLFTSEGMQFPADWSVYGQTAHVGTDGIDVSVSDATYTVKTPRGLAWIAWVTNNGKTTANTNETYSSYYPSNAGFSGSTVKLANDISLAKPNGVATGFVNNWVPIGFVSSVSGSLDNDYTKMLSRHLRREWQDHYRNDDILNLGTPCRPFRLSVWSDREGSDNGR